MIKVVEVGPGERVEHLEEIPLTDGESISITWPDYYKETHLVVVLPVFDTETGGIIRKGHLKISHHGLRVLAPISELARDGASFTRSKLW